MVITLEDLYEMKSNYEKDAERLILKASVLEDLILVAEAKVKVETPVETGVPTLFADDNIATVTVSEAETDGSY